MSGESVSVGGEVHIMNFVFGNWSSAAHSVGVCKFGGGGVTAYGLKKEEWWSVELGEELLGNFLVNDD